jgi:metal-sulfur cluster biosynthetic enzyme
MSDSNDPTPNAAPSAASETDTDEATQSSAASTDAAPPSVDQVKLALRKVKDPELNLNIMDLGLVYEVAVEGPLVLIDMTLTSPGCPAGPEIMNDVERTVKAMPGVERVAINLVWQPFWTPDKIEPRVRAYMGL